MRTFNSARPKLLYQVSDQAPSAQLPDHILATRPIDSVDAALTSPQGGYMQLADAKAYLDTKKGSWAGAYWHIERLSDSFVLQFEMRVLDSVNCERLFISWGTLKPAGISAEGGYLLQNNMYTWAKRPDQLQLYYGDDQLYAGNMTPPVPENAPPGRVYADWPNYYQGTPVRLCELGDVWMPVRVEYEAGVVRFSVKNQLMLDEYLLKAPAGESLMMRPTWLGLMALTTEGAYMVLQVRNVSVFEASPASECPLLPPLPLVGGGGQALPCAPQGAHRSGPS